jgi:hypothetical protein
MLALIASLWAALLAFYLLFCWRLYRLAGQEAAEPAKPEPEIIDNDWWLRADREVEEVWVERWRSEGWRDVP